MTCDEIKIAIDGYVDGELDPVHALEIERHVTDCASCLNVLQSTRQLRDEIRANAPRYQAPAALRARVEAATAPRRRNTSPWIWASAAAFAIAITAMIGVRFSPNPVEDQLVASHIRSLQAGHLMDVASTDRHTVKPWFAGKLDFSPQVADFPADGFALAGGRLDYVAGRPVAALIYYRAKHVINVFEWPGAGVRREKNLNGYNLVEREGSGMVFWLVSDLNAAELRHFADLLALPIAPQTQ